MANFYRLRKETADFSSHIFESFMRFA